jgi:DNA-binding MarR family transcriptional regulator
MPPSELPQHLGYWLRKLSNAVSSSFAGRLARYEVSVPQWVVMRTLYDYDSLSLKEIVARVEVDQGSLSRMVERLAARGWVQRKADPKDGRAIAISLTRTARSLVPKLAAEADANDEAFFANLPVKRRQDLLKTIHLLLADHQGDKRSPVQ